VQTWGQVPEISMRAAKVWRFLTQQVVIVRSLNLNCGFHYTTRVAFFFSPFGGRRRVKVIVNWAVFYNFGFGCWVGAVPSRFKTTSPFFSPSPKKMTWTVKSSLEREEKSYKLDRDSQLSEKKKE
jgi:hypothetical protein